MTYENYVKAKLVTLVVAEAYNGGSNDALLAVAQVIANRVSEGWQGGDWLRVITSAPEFSGTKRENPPQPDPRDLPFRDLLRRIDDVYHGIADDSAVNVEMEEGTRKALYYAEQGGVMTDWFMEKILNDPENHPRIAKVGGMVFYG